MSISVTLTPAAADRLVLLIEALCRALTAMIPARMLTASMIAQLEALSATLRAGVTAVFDEQMAPACPVGGEASGVAAARQGRLATAADPAADPAGIGAGRMRVADRAGAPVGTGADNPIAAVSALPDAMRRTGATAGTLPAAGPSTRSQARRVPRDRGGADWDRETCRKSGFAGAGLWLVLFVTIS